MTFDRRETLSPLVRETIAPLPPPREHPPVGYLAPIPYRWQRVRSAVELHLYFNVPLPVVRRRRWWQFLLMRAERQLRHARPVPSRSPRSYTLAAGPGASSLAAEVPG